MSESPGGVINAFCDPATTTSRPHRVERDRAEARHRIDHRQRTGFTRGLGERLDIRDDAGRRLGVDEEHDFGAGLLEPRPDVLRRGVSPHEYRRS